MRSLLLLPPPVQCDCCPPRAPRCAHQMHPRSLFVLVEAVACARPAERSCVGTHRCPPRHARPRRRSAKTFASDDRRGGERSCHATENAAPRRTCASTPECLQGASARSVRTVAPACPTRYRRAKPGASFQPRESVPCLCFPLRSREILALRVGVDVPNESLLVARMACQLFHRPKSPPRAHHPSKQRA